MEEGDTAGAGEEEALEVAGEEMTGSDRRCRPMARQFLGASFRQRDLSKFSEPPQSDEVVLIRGDMIIAMMNGE